MKIALVSSLMAATSLLGCDPQAGPDYTGEPLLSISGRVILENADAPDSLVPALAFSTGDGNNIYLKDVTVRGSFPASFELLVFEPPSEEVLQPLSKEPGSPRVAVASITAAPRNHDASIAWQCNQSAQICTSHDPQTGQPLGCSLDNAWCPCAAWESGPKVGDVADIDYWKVDPDGICFHEVYKCADDDPNAQHCTLDHTRGNPEFSTRPFEKVAGFSQNYQVIYSDGPIAAGSVHSRVFAGGQPIEPGYHLLKGRKPAAAEIQESTACHDQAIADYNAENGTSLPEHGYLGLPGDEDVQSALVTRMQDRGCSMAFLYGIYEVVGAGGNQHVSVEIAPDAERGATPFVFFF